MRSTLSFLAAALIPFSVLAGAPPPLDPAIAFVATGGYWNTGDKRGQYRIVVTNGGWEHVGSDVRLEWILEDPNTQSLRFLGSVLVKELGGGFWSVGQPSFTDKGDIALEATFTPNMQNIRFVLKPLSFGKYTIKQLDELKKPE